MSELKTDLICTGCSLLCDDIAIEMENGKIEKTYHVCARGYGHYFQRDFKYRILKPFSNLKGQKREISRLLLTKWSI